MAIPTVAETTNIITCAGPRCDAQVTITESVYVDGVRICRGGTRPFTSRVPRGGTTSSFHTDCDASALTERARCPVGVGLVGKVRRHYDR